MSPAGFVGALALGAGVGVISGLLGIGGGALLIPALVFLYGMSQLRAQGTAIATLLLPIGVFAFLAYRKAGNVDLKLAVVLACGIALGAWAGGTWAQHVSAVALRRTFAALLVVLAIRLAFTR